MRGRKKVQRQGSSLTISRPAKPASHLILTILAIPLSFLLHESRLLNCFIGHSFELLFPGMTVPRHSQLHPGTAVKIILKADQRSGKLTPGAIADILTRGDHPRGIKVRLTDGQIGRVQSLSTSTSLPSVPLLAESRSEPQSDAVGVTHYTGSSHARGIQQDMRADGHDPADMSDMGSLADFIKAPKKKKQTSAGRAESSRSEGSMQKLLEAEFPKIDTSLIAAILADHGELEATTDVLRTLS